MTRRRARLVVAGLLLSGTLWPSSVLPQAESAPTKPQLGDKQQQLQHVREQLQEKRERLRVVRQKERRALRDLEVLDRNSDAAERRFRNLQTDLAQTRARAQATGTSLAIVQAKLARQRVKVDARLRSIYKWGRQGYVDVLFDVTDFSEFVNRAHFLGTIMRADARLIEEYDEGADRYAMLHGQLVIEQQRINRLIAETQQWRKAIDEQEKAKQDLLARIQRERTLYEEVIADLEETDRELVSLIRKVSAGAARPGGGARLATAGTGLLRFRSFAWPSRGWIRSGFGMRRHPIFRVRKMHNGIDIASPWGDPVVAAWDGTVIYSGWFGGYGKIVIIDHGDEISTLYGHLSKIGVREGQQIRRGQVIGRVGSTGYSTGPHLHFEIRINGHPVDPTGR